MLRKQLSEKQHGSLCDALTRTQEPSINRTHQQPNAAAAEDKALIAASTGPINMLSARFLCLFLALLVFTNAFAPTNPLTPRSAALFELQACRVNAKKEKRKRNRDNMRKFQTTPGRRGLSRRKLLKKTLASRARAEEAEFITKCFITTQATDEEANGEGSGKA